MSIVKQSCSQGHRGSSLVEFSIVATAVVGATLIYLKMMLLTQQHMAKRYSEYFSHRLERLNINSIQQQHIAEVALHDANPQR